MKGFVHHCKIYAHILSFNLKNILTYRLNLFAKLIYGPAYIGVLFLILHFAFNQTSTLGGWNRSEAVLLFSVFQFIYVNCLILFLKGYRHFLWQGISAGELDFYLLKPAKPQFLVAFSKPDLDQLLLWIGILGLFLYNFVHQLPSLSVLDFVGFVFMAVIAHLIIYFTISTYAATGFFVIRAQQVMEIFDKSSDFSQYPTSIFPSSVKFIAFTFLPIAFFGYLPTLFLLSKGTINILVSSAGFLLLLIIINNFVWKMGLRHYSSASS